jgi:hypothetical protein
MNKIDGINILPIPFILSDSVGFQPSSTVLSRVAQCGSLVQ